jgi:hypothetical protein
MVTYVNLLFHFLSVSAYLAFPKKTYKSGVVGRTTFHSVASMAFYLQQIMHSHINLSYRAVAFHAAADRDVLSSVNAHN